jgi:fructose-bisphosphate aldolase class 1
MKFQNKESFEKKYKKICTKHKDDTQLKYKEMILKIEEIINALINCKNLYENNFKQ